jgi:hypothetical protein
VLDTEEDAQLRIGDALTRLYKPATRQKASIAMALGQFAALWAVHAFQKIVTTHTYAAALMCTDASRDALGEIRLPWKAFQVVVPDGVLKIVSSQDGRDIEYRRILVHVEHDGRAVLTMYDPACSMLGGAQGSVATYTAVTLADLLFDPPDGMEGSGGTMTGASPETKAMRMALRLVTGLLVAVCYSDNFSTKQQRPKGRKGDKEDREPQHRVTFVGKPLKIDLRAQVQGFLAKPGARGQAKAPSVQWFVRGHQKRQVIGVGRTGRKVIWIEPYRKGSIDAPFLTKPKLVGG